MTSFNINISFYKNKNNNKISSYKTEFERNTYLSTSQIIINDCPIDT